MKLPWSTWRQHRQEIYIDLTQIGRRFQLHLERTEADNLSQVVSVNSVPVRRTIKWLWRKEN